MIIPATGSSYDSTSLVVQQMAEARAKADIAQQDNTQTLSGIAAANVAANNSDAAPPLVNFSDIAASQDKVKFDAMAVSDKAQMQVYAQGLSGLVAASRATPANSDEESPQVSFSDIKIFLSKVEAGSVTETDMAQMQEILLKIDAQHGSHSHHQQNKQSSGSSENLAQLLIDALFSTSLLSGASNTDSLNQTLLDDLAQIGASAGSNSAAEQTAGQANVDNMNNINKQMISSLIQAYISSSEKAATQDLKA